MKHSSNHIIKESVEARELFLVADNESDIYFRFIVPIVRNLHKHYKKGNFDNVKACDAFYPVANYTAKLYCKRFGNLEEWNKVFDVTARYTAAAMLLKSYYENIINNDI